VPIFIIS